MPWKKLLALGTDSIDEELRLRKPHPPLETEWPTAAQRRRTAEGNHLEGVRPQPHGRPLCTDFFTTEVWSCFGLITYYILFFIHFGTRRVHIGGITSMIGTASFASISMVYYVQ